jgi:hypothetical protein
MPTPTMMPTMMLTVSHRPSRAGTGALLCSEAIDTLAGGPEGELDTSYCPQPFLPEEFRSRLEEKFSGRPEEKFSGRLQVGG